MDEEVGVKVVEAVELAIKWAGKEVAVLLPADRQTVADLRRELYLLTRVPPERQKLLGLKPSPGKSLDDVPSPKPSLRACQSIQPILFCAGFVGESQTRVADLGLKKGAKVMMMGTPEEAQLVEPEEQFDVRRAPPPIKIGLTLSATRELSRALLLGRVVRTGAGRLCVRPAYDRRARQGREHPEAPAEGQERTPLTS